MARIIGLAVPDGITLVFLPPYSLKLQPAERLWPLVDEPVANRLRHLGRPRGRRRRALPSARCHHDQAAHPFPLLAKLGSAELINRSSYESLMRPVSWPNPAATPPPGAWCSCCGRHERQGGQWWRELEAPTGWRCYTCHPPLHLDENAVWVVRT